MIKQTQKSIMIDPKLYISPEPGFEHMGLISIATFFPPCQYTFLCVTSEEQGLANCVPWVKAGTPPIFQNSYCYTATGIHL